MEHIGNPGKFSWDELQEYNKTNPLFHRIQHNSGNPFTTESIDKLVHNGWKAKLSALTASQGLLIPGAKLIVIRDGMPPYERDKTLFHELAHEHYPKLHPSSFPSIDYGIEAVAEWLGRTWRANPVLLNHAVLSFGLDPKMYDFPSYIAFRNQEQLEFPFVSEFFREQQVFMD